MGMGVGYADKRSKLWPRKPIVGGKGGCPDWQSVTLSAEVTVNHDGYATFAVSPGAFVGSE